MLPSVASGRGAYKGLVEPLARPQIVPKVSANSRRRTDLPPRLS